MAPIIKDSEELLSEFYTFQDTIRKASEQMAREVDDKIIKYLEEEMNKSQLKYTAKAYDKGVIDVLIDGDVIAYRASAATNGVSYSAGKGHFKTKKDAITHAALYSIEPTAVTKNINPEPVAHALGNVDNQIRSILDAVEEKYPGYRADPVVCVTGDTNFRSDVSPDYKKSRDPSNKPYHLEDCKKFLIDKHHAQLVEGYEADDIMCIESYAREHEDCVIATIDKDLLQVPGEHYNFVTGLFRTITPEEGRHRFWKQVLTGDRADDIEGLYGIGPKKSEKLLEDMIGKSEWEYYSKVLDIYYDKIPKEEDESEMTYVARVVKRVHTACKLLAMCKEYDGGWKMPTITGKDSSPIHTDSSDSSIE